MSFGGVIALNHLAVWRYLDEYERRYGLEEDRFETFERVMACSQEVIKSMNDAAKEQREAETHRARGK